MLAARAGAQSDAVTLPPDQIGIKTPHRPATTGTGLHVPPPPRSMFLIPKHALPPVPEGQGGNPQPDTPPARVVESAPPVAGTGAFTYFRNRRVQPPGANRSVASVVEPCAVQVNDTVMHVGNWYAALSRDQGETWTSIFPQSFFPPLDAGFCCDQRIDYVESHDLTCWVMQYGYSATTRKGSHQIAIANGRNELRSANASDWTLYQFDPTDFGFPLGTWLDFPDVGFNADWLYLSANVYDGSSGAFRGAVVWRVSLHDLRQNGPATFTWLTDATMGGNSYRFATRAGDGSAMYWATLMSTTTIRIWRQHTIGIVRDYVDRPTAAWRWSITQDCAGPDGRGWLGDAQRNPIGRIRGACGTDTELVFAWTSDGNGGNRPFPYTRVARYRVSDRTTIAEHDIYSPTDCWAYAALDSNTLGDIGGVIAIGGPNRYVRTSSFVIDQYEPWNAVVAYRMGNPTNNPPGEYFGDYFDVQRSSIDGRTFVGAGTFMRGGDRNEHVEPHYVWFGRNDYEPVRVVLDVRASAIGVPITIDVTDVDGLKDGNTPFQRTFMPSQGYELTAPQQFTSGATTWVFDRWVHDGIERPAGQRTLTIANMGTTADVAEARYRVRRTITFQTSPHITTPVGLTVTPQDLNGQAGGLTTFTRQYLQGTQVTVTLPSASVGGHPFHAWRVGSVLHPVGQRTITFTVLRDDSVTALFLVHTPGSYVPFGTGCDGSNGPDVHTGVGRPEIGMTVRWQVVGGPASVPAVLLVGASNTMWNGARLPLPIPGAPGCGLLTAIDVTLPAFTASGGAAVVPLDIPTTPNLIGGHVYTQFLCVDPGANQMGISASNGLDTLVGGSR
ncbi:MAG TPA: hypothetical protein VK081_10915 [Planctomycetota bacterium]|nr:hypothetical protein [Planctomycetota bacterium]